MPLIGTEGERIGYEVHDGPADAPPLVLIHGFTASAASFISNLHGLTGRFTVITVDLLGHGSSDAPEGVAAYGPDAAVARIVALFDHLGLDHPLVCGHSLGGALALRFALDRPERLSGLVVLNSNSAAGTPEWREHARANMREMATRVRAEGTDFMHSTRLYPGNSKRLPPEARRLLTESFEQLSPAGIAGTAEGLTVDVNSFERLGDLRTPTLVVIGDRDRGFVQNAPRFVVRMPRELVETFTIEGAGHAANLEEPELFNEALFAFATRIGYLSPAKASATTRDKTDDGPSAGGLAAVPVAGDTAIGSDDGLGPTLYAGALTALRAGGRSAAMATLGGGLIVFGAAMFVAAFVVGGGGEGAGVAIPASAGATQTATPIEQSAGVRTTASSTSASTATAVQAEQQSPTPVPSAAEATSASTPTRTPTPTSIATSTPPAEASASSTPTPTPTSAPTRTPLPTPAGPTVSISGPTSGQPGALLTFSASEIPAAITRTWSASNGTSAAHTSAFTVTFVGAGCHTVTLTGIFPGGVTRTATRTVAVGVASCG